MMPTEDEKLHARIAANVFEAEGSDCWIWTGALTHKGYGHLSVNGKMTYAHRASYTLCIGPIPEGLFVLHKRHCTSRACCNPEHLYVGTEQDNADDRMALGRHVAPKGEAAGRAILTADKVQMARLMILHGVGVTEIARRLGVGASTIRSIKIGKSWAHLPWPDKPQPTITVNRRGL
jgi:hypothetical protein